MCNHQYTSICEKYFDIYIEFYFFELLVPFQVTSFIWNILFHGLYSNGREGFCYCPWTLQLPRPPLPCYAWELRVPLEKHIEPSRQGYSGFKSMLEYGVFELKSGLFTHVTKKSIWMYFEESYFGWKTWNGSMLAENVGLGRSTGRKKWEEMSYSSSFDIFLWNSLSCY